MAIKPVSGEIKAQILNDNLSYLESIALKANGGPIDDLSSESALNAKYPNGANGLVLVNGYLYRWDSAWLKGSAFNPAPLKDFAVDNIKLAEKAVTHDKTDLFETGVNLFDRRKVILDKYCNQYGIIADNNQYMMYEIRNPKNNQYINFVGSSANKRYARFITAYDANNAVVVAKGLDNVSEPVDTKFLIQTGISRLVLTFHKAYILNDLDLMIAYSQNVPNYKKFEIVPDEKMSFTTNQKDFVETEANKHYVPTKNLFDYTLAKTGFIEPGGGIGPDQNHYYSSQLAVKVGDVIGAMDKELRDINLRHVAAYDANGMIIQNAGVSNGAENVFTYTVTNENVSYAVLSIAITKKAGAGGNLNGCPKEDLMIYKGAKPTEFVEYGVLLSNNVALNERQIAQVQDGTTILSGKKLTVFGTSISHGHATGLSYADQLADKYGMILSKVAVNGAKLINILNQIEDYSGSPDIIIFDGGANDNNVTPAELNLGVLTTDYTSTLDTSTIFGCMESILKTLQTKFLGIPVIYLNVHRLYTRRIDTQEIVSNALLDSCKKWGASVVDLYHYSTFNAHIPAIRAEYTYDTLSDLKNGNGTHPNAQGYERFYVPQIKNKLISLL